MTFKSILLRVNMIALMICTLEAALGFAVMAYFVRVLGTVVEANIASGIFWASLFIFELPTGYLVDKWGARNSLILSLIVRISAFVLFYMSTTYPSMVYFANALAGFAVTFMTGIFSCQILSESRQNGIEVDYPSMSSAVILVRASSLIFGTLLGYVISKYFGSLDVIWLMCALIALISLLAIYMTWPNIRSSVEATMHLHYASAVKAIRSSPILTTILILSLFRTITLPIGANSIFMFVPELDDAPERMMMFYLLLGGIGFLASKLQTKIDIQNNVLGYWTLCALLLFFSSLKLAIWAFICFLVFMIVSELVENEIRRRFYQDLPVDNAGSITSLQNILENMLGMVSMFLAALVLTGSKLNMLWGIASFLLIASLPILLKMRKREAIPTTDSNAICKAISD